MRRRRCWFGCASECFTGDLLGSLRCDCGDQLRGAIKAIAEAGGGVLLYLAQEGRGIGLVNKLRGYQLQDAGFDTFDADEQLGFDADERVYLPAAQMLRRLGFGTIRLMTNNPEKMVASSVTASASPNACRMSLPRMATTSDICARRRRGAAISSEAGGFAAAQAALPRGPKIAVPTRTWVAPKRIAFSKSALMPMLKRSSPLRRAISRSSAKCSAGSSSCGGTHMRPAIGSAEPVAAVDNEGVGRRPAEPRLSAAPRRY